jgi:hypothetical protein
VKAVFAILIYQGRKTMASPERNIHQGAFVVPVLMSVRVLIVVSLITFCAVNDVNAQEVKPIQSASAITVAASGDRVRFTAPSNVVQMHLQVYDNAGQLIFDVNSKGNVLDWTLQDSGGARLIPGSYLSVVTVKSLSGKISQRIGSVSVQEKQLELQRVEAAQMSPGQQLAVGPIEENGALTILQAGETEATTVIAHDGTQGEITRSRGALSFRLGDFFSGKDEEQMRLTEKGNLGIGTDKPQAKLDVAGVIRTSKGIEFANGTDGTNVTKLTTTANGNLQQTLADGTVVPNATGTGTQDKLAKWTDNAGTLGDSTITEVGGRVGIGVSNPTYKLVVGPDIGPGLTTSDLTISRGPGQSVSIYAGATGAHGMNFGWDEANQRAFVNAPVQSPITFTHGGISERMRIATSGNVGIGTTAPEQKLEVAGNVKVSGNGNGFMFSDGTSMTTAGASLGANSFNGNQSVTGNVSATGNISAGGSVSGNGSGLTNLNASNVVSGTVPIGALAGTYNINISGNAATATSAATATDAAKLGGVAASNYVQTVDPRLSDARPPTAGSTNYIQNTTSQQSSGNFNISGDGMAGGLLSGNLINSSTQYMIGGSRVLSVPPGTQNFFAGVGAGQSNTTGNNNSFVGANSGLNNTTGAFNSFFGVSAGFQNNTSNDNSFFGYNAGSQNTGGANAILGSGNSFFGSQAGSNNTTGFHNSFFGQDVGSGNTTGNGNSFFGRSAGSFNTMGVANSYFGELSGLYNTTGENNSFFGNGAGQGVNSQNNTGGGNSFFGADAGKNNTSGNANTFVGESAGLSNSVENNNTFIGYLADGAVGITNATAIGAKASVTQSNSMVLGSINGQNGATADTKVGIGTTRPNAKLQVTGGDVFVDTVGTGLILKSSRDSCFRVTVDDFGVLKTTAVSCP